MGVQENNVGIEGIQEDREVRYRKHEQKLECANDVENETDVKAKNVFPSKHSNHIDKITPVKRSVKRVASWCLLVLVCGVTVLFLLINRAPEVPYLKPYVAKFRSKAIRFGSAAVAADATICSSIGRNILEKRNGSAVDSAIASILCVGLVNSHSLGIGGGFISTIYDSQTKEVYVLDSREVAPMLAREDMFVNDPMAAINGPLAIGVPGELRGYWEMHQRFGRLPWADLFQPTIDLCENGFPVYRALARAREKIMEDGRENEKLIGVEGGFLHPLCWLDVMQTFKNPTTGEWIKRGDVLTRPKLAKTLRLVAQEGADSFYTGSLSKLVLADLKDAGSIIIEEDLRTYRAKWRTPAHITLKDGLRVYAPPSPGGGLMLLLSLSILDGFDMDNTSLSTVDRSILTYHRFIESFKFAHTLREKLADPDFVDVSKELADRFRQRISDERTFDSEYYGTTHYNKVKPGTGHLSVMDEQGNAVALTSSLNQYAGSTVLGERTAILFNSAMDDFSIPGIPNRFQLKSMPMNYIKQGKRALSSMAPTIILKGDKSIKMVTGAAGGSKIPTIVAQVIMRVLKFGQNMTVATDGPRLHHQLLPKEVFAERRYPSAVIKGLEAKGHVFTPIPTRGTVVQSILVEDGELIAISDDRKGGVCDGY